MNELDHISQAIERAPLAPYACNPFNHKGRLHQETESESRNAFLRDRDRIIHSGAFRRLQYKTQVFVYHEGDYYRTRLTHSIEVSQIARTISRALSLSWDLAEAVSLAHDLGHPPFGHAGERELAKAMQDFGGFDHNGQTIKVVTELEQRYAEFDGLNLTWDTLEGIAKHNGPLVTANRGLETVHESIRNYNARHDLWLDSHASAEAQVAAVSDDVAYDNHDLDDGLRHGLFDIEAVLELPLVGDVFRSVKQKFPTVDDKRWVYESVRRMIGIMVEDVIAESHRRLQEHKPQSVDDVRRAGRPMVDFSDEFKEAQKHLKNFLFHNMYRHYKVNRMMYKAERIVADLFKVFMEQPGLLKDEWRIPCMAGDDATRARIVADYIGGMTDRYAIREHARIFDLHTGM